jgi:hypothetical protein
MSRIIKQDQRSPGYAATVPLPVLLGWKDLLESRGDVFQAILRGLEQWGEDGKDFIKDESVVYGLRNAVTFGAAPLWFVIYGECSLQMPLYESSNDNAQERTPAACLLELKKVMVVPNRHAITFIASDEHHGEFIRTHWGLQRRFTHSSRDQPPRAIRG